jgi:hypoxanthine phosphoribosyltransferase
MSDPMAGISTVTIGGLRFRPMIDAGQIHDGVARIAAQLAVRYAGRRPILLCVLNGAALFHADLVRMLPIPLELDYLRVASYHGGTVSSGEIIFTAEPGTQMAGRNVILVEDIVDTGRTVERLRGYCMEKGAESVEVATLLYKRDAHLIGREPEYAAFQIPNRFVIGFGLDYLQEGRNLPAIFVLEHDRIAPTPTEASDL